jgi:hypothetical protein
MLPKLLGSVLVVEHAKSSKEWGIALAIFDEALQERTERRLNRHSADRVAAFGRGFGLPSRDPIALLIWIVPASRSTSETTSASSFTVPFKKQFWGDHYGNFTDKFGVQWAITYPSKA